ncbi:MULTISPECIES: amino acid ABC transporter permease [Carnobacterium]|uniref:amino acid ABC transporter permease n=1 Tax=Carnobacterium TaxID=2747 RepID=UPI00288E06CC|nr:MULTISPECIES: amino acid ABC transporter permease [Carnobacterium]MDT1939124.1 amino acid ABC transporter permease [Carnobacterium divergens]MDT1941562.1 amino acid ABC transporter permease [Carnobacterium divergens]MDT1947360.1 amino acid ABC transporter permease [Carnobacterium divergens]MDT1949799.1 amino acid ABC transporter permease [Carnobacterium divergens]MDT1954977.1 amino acid ABC transporter permease [Carnobacterium divergens]
MTMITELLPALLEGLKTTLFLFSIILIVTIPLGFLVAIIRVYAPKGISLIVQFYIYIMRGTPLLLQLMVVFFGLPHIGITLDRFPAAVIAFALNYTAYYAEIFRGGILAVPKGQFEAVQVLGIGKIRGYRRIIIPQVTRIVLPSVGNEVISLVKDTSLVYILGLGELLRAGQIASNTYASLIPFVAVGIIYLLITGLVTLGLTTIEKRIHF